MPAEDTGRSALFFLCLAVLFLPTVGAGINPGLVFNIAVAASSSVIGNGSGGE